MKVKHIPIVMRNILHKVSAIKPEVPQNYWRNPEDYGNSPLGHAGLDDTINHSIYMLEQINGLKIPKNSSILEVGCNCGKNINYLYKNGYNNLSGIDINPKAIKLMKQMFSDLYYNSNIKVDTLEKSLVKIRSNAYDVTFALTVLMHLHTDSNFVFKEIVRISKKYVITLEDENCKPAWSHYPRNYKKIFEDLGMKQIKEEKCDNILKNHTLRIFKK